MLNFIRKIIVKLRWYLIVSLILAIVVFYGNKQSAIYHNPFVKKAEQSEIKRKTDLSIQKTTVLPSWIRRDTQACKPMSDIAYLKSHKTGSTAIQAMLFRYGIKNNLTFPLPRDQHFSFEKPFRKEMVYPQNMIGKGKFNIFAIHCVWNMKEITLLMPPDTIFISSVREPSSIFVSLFDYFYFQEKSGMTLAEFVQNVFVCEKAIKTVHGYHQLLHDFGLTMEQFDNFWDVRKTIVEADKNFQLVLVMEKMEESLILLRHLLCWTHEDVAIFNVNARQEEFKSTMSKETKDILRKRQRYDYWLYNHFKTKLERLIENFGKERMQSEVNELRKATLRIRERCHIVEKKSEYLTGEKKLWSNKVIGIDVHLNNTSEECHLLALSEESLKEYVRNKQNARLNLSLDGA